jgi:hypothetical protein
VRRPRGLTYASVVATLALMAALGGTSYAAVTLGRGVVKTPNLANGAVTAAKVRAHTLLARNFAPGVLGAGVGVRGPAGPPGLQGPAGPTGPAGSARAYAVVRSTGAIVAARSHGVASVQKPSSAPVGTYCVTLAAGIDPASAAPVVSADLGDTAASSKDYGQVDTAGTDCGGGLEVVMRHLSIDSTTSPVTVAAHRSDTGFSLVVP